jgi:hypothetical protein
MLRKTNAKFIFSGATIASIVVAPNLSGKYRRNISETSIYVWGKQVHRRGIRCSKLRLYKTEMRSGPATQTAFAMRESHRCLPRSERFRSGDVANACPFPALSCGGCTRARKRDCIRSRGWSQSRHARPFLRRPQRPVAHNAFTFRKPQQSVPCIAQADRLACRSRALRSVHQAFRSASDKLSG